VAEAWRDGALTDCVRRVRVLRGARLSTQAPDKVSATAMPIWLELELGEAKPEALRREEVRRIRARQRAGEGLPGRIFADLKRLPAGEIVSDAGLCGVRLRQARIGHKEPNNIINLGGATARDLSLLVQLVRDRVKRVSGVEIKTLHNPIGHG
jgi:UDP-N-acetylmuramate--alanine ligase